MKLWFELVVQGHCCIYTRIYINIGNNFKIPFVILLLDIGCISTLESTHFQPNINLSLTVNCIWKSFETIFGTLAAIGACHVTIIGRVV